VRARVSAVAMIRFISAMAEGLSAGPEVLLERELRREAELPDPDSEELTDDRLGIETVFSLAGELPPGALARPAMNAPAEAMMRAAAVSGIFGFIVFAEKFGEQSLWAEYFI
jgi:hypothetical protein